MIKEPTTPTTALDEEIGKMMSLDVVTDFFEATPLCWIFKILSQYLFSRLLPWLFVVTGHFFVIVQESG